MGKKDKKTIECLIPPFTEQIVINTLTSRQALGFGAKNAKQAPRRGGRRPGPGPAGAGAGPPRPQERGAPGRPPKEAANRSSSWSLTVVGRKIRPNIGGGSPRVPAGLGPPKSRD